jgi:CTP synthase
LIVEKLSLKARPLDISDWESMLQRLRNPTMEVSIAVVGKYIRHNDAYKSIYESLDHAGISTTTRVSIRKIEGEDIENEGAERQLAGVDAILVPGGFGYRGIPGKIDAIRYARENKIPFFGICLGLQCAVIEFGKNVVGLPDPNTTEIDKNCKSPVVCLLDEQYSITDLGGTMRLGTYPCKLDKGSLAHRAYGSELVQERHRHRYEFNNHYRAQFEKHGMKFSGTSPDGNLVEVVELNDHPWFLAVQSHPEFKSKPTKAHPLFVDFVQAARVRHEGKGKGK